MMRTPGKTITTVLEKWKLGFSSACRIGDNSDNTYRTVWRMFDSVRYVYAALATGAAGKSRSVVWFCWH
jgi:hypothetical protein